MVFIAIFFLYIELRKCRFSKLYAEKQSCYKIPKFLNCHTILWGFVKPLPIWTNVASSKVHMNTYDPIKIEEFPFIQNVLHRTWPSRDKVFFIYKLGLLLKVKQSRNVFFKPTILPKKERTNLVFLPNSITCIIMIILFRSFFGRIRGWQRVLSKLPDLYIFARKSLKWLLGIFIMCS